MSVNSSSNSSLHTDNCFNSRGNISLFMALFISSILLLPLFILVLYVGYQRWRKHRSVATAAMMSHSDVFTFNMVALELISFLGLCFFFYGIYTNELTVLMLGFYIYLAIPTGQSLFHLLTCVERYLAVVHPITYLRLRQSGGVRIRNTIIGFVWLFIFVSQGLLMINNFSNLLCFIIFFLVVAFVVVSFCSLSVLCVLIRPGPGEVGRQRKRVDQSKQRAFYTIMVIMGALSLRFLMSLVSYGAQSLSMLSPSERCVVSLLSPWFCMPSSMVLPLLFLRRAGKLPKCKHNTGSG